MGYWHTKPFIEKELILFYRSCRLYCEDKAISPWNFSCGLQYHWTRVCIVDRAAINFAENPKLHIQNWKVLNLSAPCCASYVWTVSQPKCCVFSRSFIFGQSIRINVVSPVYTFTLYENNALVSLHSAFCSCGNLLSAFGTEAVKFLDITVLSNCFVYLSFL